MPSNSVELVFADPPYNLSKKKGLKSRSSGYVTMQEIWDRFSREGFFKFNQQWLTECIRILKPGGSLWVCGSFHNIYQIGFLLQAFFPELKINNSIVWLKPNAMPNLTRRLFTESTEHLIWAVKRAEKWKFNYEFTRNGIEDALNHKGRQTRNVWCIPATPQNEKWAGKHPTQKPSELLRRIILSCTEPGDLVLDPFCGSGTAAIAAFHAKRNSISIEANQKYVRLAEKRLAHGGENYG